MEGVGSKEKSFGCIPLCPRGGGMFLLVQHRANDGNRGHWSFPKGHQESFEYEFDTAIRELREETGLLPDEFLKDEVFIEKYSYEHVEGHQVHKKNTFYLTLFVGMPVPCIDGREIVAARWVNFETAKNLLTFGSAQDVLKEAYMTATMNGLIE